ncbi:hypothetical protein BJ742DRAFT_738107 [Cladochytrium replicatum]|nr:hypothetical protein BJ742DRAFT_738107 [Cladochytrium replicatum]
MTQEKGEDCDQDEKTTMRTTINVELPTGTMLPRPFLRTELKSTIDFALGNSKALQDQKNEVSNTPSEEQGTPDGCTSYLEEFPEHSKEESNHSRVWERHDE